MPEQASQSCHENSPPKCFDAAQRLLCVGHSGAGHELRLRV
jgi:hypothetical protein